MSKKNNKSGCTIGAILCSLFAGLVLLVFDEPLRAISNELGGRISQFYIWQVIDENVHSKRSFVFIQGCIALLAFVLGSYISYLCEKFFMHRAYFSQNRNTIYGVTLFCAICSLLLLICLSRSVLAGLIIDDVHKITKVSESFKIIEMKSKIHDLSFSFIIWTSITTGLIELLIGSILYFCKTFLFPYTGIFSGTLATIRLASPRCWYRTICSLLKFNGKLIELSQKYESKFKNVADEDYTDLFTEISNSISEEIQGVMFSLTGKQNSVHFKMFRKILKEKEVALELIPKCRSFSLNEQKVNAPPPEGGGFKLVV